MNLADVFTVTLVILGFLIVYIAYWLMSAGLFPRFVERCSEQLGRAPILTTIVGAVTLVPVVAVGLAISSKAPNGAAKIAGLAIALVGMLGALFGSAGLALRIGTGLKSHRDERDPWRRVLRGGVVLGLTFVMPFLGTFVVMPLAFAAGFGAFVFCVLRRKVALAPATELTVAPSSISRPSEAMVPPPMPTVS